jgi:hypothetical protein
MARNSQPVFECIVAHYNEELSWLEELAPDTIIYSKGGSRENQLHILPSLYH